MSVPSISHSKSVLQTFPADAARKPKALSFSDEKRAREAFYNAVRDCDKAMENVIDKHLESVKEAAIRLAEYRKRKAVEDRARNQADMMRELNEKILIERINNRNMLEEMRMKRVN